MRCGSEAGSYSRLRDFVYHSTLGWIVIREGRDATCLLGADRCRQPRFAPARESARESERERERERSRERERKRGKERERERECV